LQRNALPIGNLLLGARPREIEIVPVEVACFRSESTTKPGDISQRLAIPVSGPPEIEAAHHEKQETDIAGARDRACNVAIIAFGAEPAMPISDNAKESAGLLRAFAEDRAGVWIDEECRFTTEADLRGRRRV
jgi:hypothetical protein